MIIYQNLIVLPVKAPIFIATILMIKYVINLIFMPWFNIFEDLFWI